MLPPRLRHLQGAVRLARLPDARELLSRIIRASSNVGDTVLDPFGGSGTTLAVAKKLDRRFLGCELSAAYAARIRERLAGIRVGQPLDGAAEPLKSVPPTSAGRRLRKDKRRS